MALLALIGPLEIVADAARMSPCWPPYMIDTCYIHDYHANCIQTTSTLNICQVDRTEEILAEMRQDETVLPEQRWPYTKQGRKKVGTPP